MHQAHGGNAGGGTLRRSEIAGATGADGSQTGHPRLRET
jgi:hypothetical protein